MRKVSDIIGFPVCCSDQKKFHGEVKDAILDLRNYSVIGLIVDYGSIIHHTRVLSFNSIYEINNNKVIVKFRRNIKQINSLDLNEDYIKKNQNILGFEVKEEDGRLIGFIKDVIFEEKSGNILGFVLTNGLVDDIFNGMQILPYSNYINFYKDNVVVLKDTKNSILKNIGGLKKLLELEH